MPRDDDDRAKSEATGAQNLSFRQKQKLLQYVRQAVTQACKTASEKPKIDIGDFAGHGAFVTLHKKDPGNSRQLRGCIGTFSASNSTLKTLAEMAVAASLRDPRFPPVSADELKNLDVEISLLTPLQSLDDVDKIVIGQHGLCISRGWQRGVLLPQVASENGWDRETFLQQTCRKAGLPPDAWRDADVKIESFEAIVFGEQDRP